MPIGTTIKTIQDIMRKDAGVDGDAQRISQLGWMIFLKVFDDREVEKELLDDRYKSPVPGRLRWRAWAKDPEGITGEALLDFVNNDLFKTLKELPTSGKHAAVAGVVRGVFEDAYNYMKSGTLMRQVINKLNEIDFNRAADRHEFGDIYEKILSDLQNAGNAGEYYTPRAVTQFIVDQIAPKLGEKVLDPACGTGGFLTCTIEHVRKKYVRSAEHEALLQASVFGVEKKPLPHLLCVTNMIFHGIEVPSNIRHDNTLARPLRDYGPKDRVDVIVTNPPFGGMEEDGIENNFPQAFRTRETADLFLVLLMTLLKPGGHAALVLPDGTLFGEGVKTRIKEKLLEECNLHTIVRLPNGAFSPYTGIKTNLLFFEKGTPTKEVWYYEHPYPPGYKSYSKTKPLRIEEFAPEKKWWSQRQENDRAWKVSIGDIKGRGYNLDIKNPSAVDDRPGDADALLQQYQEVTAETTKIRDALRDEIQVATMRFCSASGGTGTNNLSRESRLSVAPLMAALDSPSRVSKGRAEGPEELAAAWKRVAANFEVLLGRPEAVDEVRQAVLEVAFQGRLGRSASSDEGVEELLGRIDAERKSHQGKAFRGDLEIEGDDAPYMVPSSWRWVPWGRLTLETSSGWSPQCQNRPRADEEWGVLKVSAVSWVRFKPSENKALPKGIAPRVEFSARKGDFLMSRANTAELVGRSVIVDREPERLILSDKIVRCVFSKYVTPEYVNLYNRTSTARSHYVAHASGTSDSMKNISRDVILAMPVPFPPLAEQRRIVARVAHLMKLCDDLDASLRRADETAAKLVEAAVAEIVAW